MSTPRRKVFAVPNLERDRKEAKRLRAAVAAGDRAAARSPAATAARSRLASLRSRSRLGTAKTFRRGVDMTTSFGVRPRPLLPGRKRVVSGFPRCCSRWDDPLPRTGGALLARWQQSPERRRPCQRGAPGRRTRAR